MQLSQPFVFIQLLLLVSGALLCSCRPSRSVQRTRHDERDPLIALASDDNVASSAGVELVGEQQPAYAYEPVVGEEATRAQDYADLYSANPEQLQHQQNFDQGSYELNQGVQTAQMLQEQGLICNDHNECYFAGASTSQQQPQQQQPQEEREYVGDAVVYVDQYGNVLPPNTVPQSSQQPLEQPQQEAPAQSPPATMSAESLPLEEADAAHAQQERSAKSLQATILTEIPIKDMPIDLLQQLKQQYGVKVVATRDHPSAGLKINCDDSSSRGVRMCAKQMDFSLINNYEYPNDQRAPQQGSVVSVEQPQFLPMQGARDQLEPATEQPNYAVSANYTTETVADYVTRVNEAGASGSNAPSDERLSNESFGIRNTPLPPPAEPSYDSYSAPTEPAATEPSAQQYSTLATDQAQADASGDANSGFEYAAASNVNPQTDKSAPTAASSSSATAATTNGSQRVHYQRN